MTTRFLTHSLQMRLALRLFAVFALAAAMVVAFLVYQNYDTAASLGDRQLTLRAEDLAQSVSVDASGVPTLTLPPQLASSYAAAQDSDLFAIRMSDGRPIAASPVSFGTQVAAWPQATDRPDYFHLQQFGPRGEDYYGLTVALSSAVGRVSVTVAHAVEISQLIHSLLLGFVVHIGWLVPIFVVITLIIGIVAIRSGLRPVREVSRMAAAIGPSATSIRLPEATLPSELIPLVSAMNCALDRLEQGFVTQREFTANAAHELRTPLSIITTALDSIRDDPRLSKLKGDVVRMNRIVNQLLRVARLDAVALDISSVVDLDEIAAGVVAAMAPWAIEQGRSIGFDTAGRPVLVRGNADAIEAALRNLLENAIVYSPRGEEVTVRVDRDGSISVTDRGYGIPAEQRERIFERFWRAKGNAVAGAGLGLAIVQQIMKAHRGIVTVRENASMGTVFRLNFPLS